MVSRTESNINFIPLGRSRQGIGFSSQPAISHHQFTLHAVGYCPWAKITMMELRWLYSDFITFHLWLYSVIITKLHFLGYHYFWRKLTLAKIAKLHFLSTLNKILILYDLRKESESRFIRIHEAAPRVSLVKGERDVRSEVTSAW